MHASSLNSHSQHPTSALVRLANLRLAVILSMLAGLLLSVSWLQIELPLGFIVPAIGVLLVANMVAQRQIRAAQPVLDLTLFGHLSTDLLAVAWTLYCAGGASNPFAPLLLLPLTIAATSLPARLAWVLTTLGLALYTLLVFVNIPLPPPQGQLQALDAVLAETCSIGGDHPGSAPGSGFALHIVGMWVNFVLSAVILAYFLLQQSSALRHRETALHTFRERALRQEKVLAMGLMAAGAAHKMGTPLSTLAVMVGEALNVPKDTPPEAMSREELKVMQEQVERCKHILAEMVAAATPQSRPPVSATSWLAEWVDEWHVLRPSVPRPHFTVRAVPQFREPLLCPDRSLDQALQGLLDNAADAMSEATPKHAPADKRLTIEIDWDPENVRVDILDRGPGIPEQLASVLGLRFVTTKENINPQRPLDERPVGGMGIGFFLTNASIERFGGKVELFPREGGGTCTCVQIPLARLNPQPWEN